MSEAPRAIWAKPGIMTVEDGSPWNFRGGIWQQNPFGRGPETHYIRADIAQAELDAAVREAASDVWNAVQTLAASGTPIEVLASMARDNAAAILERGK